MNPIIAREGYPIIGTIFCISAVLFIVSLLTGGGFSGFFRICAAVVFLLVLFSLYFFRDPERTVPADRQALISPADGTIIDIRTVHEPLYLDCEALRVSIFMSVFNVHVNRSPVNGTIEFLRYNPGKFFSAFKDKASEENESMFAGIQCWDRPEKIGVNVIAGLIARRLVFYKKRGDVIRQGQRINIIRFGSRVDLYCPLNASVTVKKGDAVTAGLSVIARFPNG